MFYVRSIYANVKITQKHLDVRLFLFKIAFSNLKFVRNWYIVLRSFLFSYWRVNDEFYD